jgi:hypothetical protein
MVARWRHLLQSPFAYKTTAMRFTNPWITWVALGACALAGCGGGGSGTSSTTPPPSSPAPPTTNDPLTLQLSASTYSAAQSAGSVTVSVVRSSGSSAAASVQYATSDGTAAAGTNYTGASGTLSWSDGDATAKTFAVTLSSTPFTGSKTFNVVLSNATGANVGLPANAVVTINGSGAAAAPGTVALSASTVSIAQSAGSVTLTVSRTGGSSGAASVKYATSNGTAVSGSNYTAASGTLNWAAADAAAKTFAVALSNTAFSGAKNFTVTLSAASGATLGSPASEVVTINGSTTGAGSGAAAQLAVKLGMPSRMLVGLGSQAGIDTITGVQQQALKVDIYDAYMGAGDWTSWNAPPCDYACVVAGKAKSINAIPMYTYYQMANNGDGNISVVNDATFMGTYWSRLKTLFQDIAALKTPALVNVEPDFWGYIELNAPNHDPTQMAAVVSSNPDCATLPNTVAGYAGCVLAMARKYATNAYIGFPPSSWGGSSTAAVVAFMNLAGAQNADFIVEETLDRDAGCFEASPQPSECARGGSGYYWDETNQTHPNFQDHLAEALAWHTGIGNLPIIWWQTPEGVPSATPGGTPGHYRDNRVHYFLTHPDQLVAVGGLGVVFSNGAADQTSIATDGGQFQTLSGAYMAAPTALP